MTSQNKLFREYATRISFNISLSRNQIFTLWNISEGRLGNRQAAIDFGIGSDMFVPGAKWLESHGLLTYTDPVTMKPKWKDYPFKLTEAGEHILSLVRIAGIIPEQSINNNKKRA